MHNMQRVCSAFVGMLCIVDATGDCVGYITGAVPASFKLPFHLCRQPLGLHAGTSKRCRLCTGIISSVSFTNLGNRRATLGLMEEDSASHTCA